MEDVHPFNSEKSRKYRMNKWTQDAGELFGVITEVKKGDFSVCMSIDSTGIAGKINDALNDVIGLNRTKSAV